MQKSWLAVQVVLSHKDVPIGVAFMFFAQALFVNHLTAKLPAIAAIDATAIDAAAVPSGSATDLVAMVLPARLSEALDVYNASLVKAFFAVVVSCVTLPPCFEMEWKYVRTDKPSVPAEKPTSSTT